MKWHAQLKKHSRGDALILVIVVVALVGIMELPLFQVLATMLKAARTAGQSEQALQIAEAGIDYYQWHLAHFPTDYEDGTGKAGPYVHTYTDYDSEQTLGSYSLSIKPPDTGSTVVTITSTGWSASNPNVKRTITARYGIPSLAVDAFLTNDIIWIGSDETVNGQMHSNNGIRFDGTGNAPITSAKATYTCGQSQGCSSWGQTKPGIWGSAPAATQNYWNYPVPAIDFGTITENLATLKSDAEENGIYLSPSNKDGYSLVFNADGTVSIYTVTSTAREPTGSDVNNNSFDESTDYSGRTLLEKVALPNNGIIYVEDNVWVEGTVSGRVMVAAAELPYSQATAPNIFIPNNITYAAKDGSDVLGLLAQQNIIVSYAAPSDLEIDAALIAQNGSTEFLYYSRSRPIKSKITVFGSIMTYGQWTWTWVDGSGGNISGYTTTNDTYDSNLLYGPPPGFPLSSAGYQQLSWVSN